jgi:WXG100 family type VII secretion target
MEEIIMADKIKVNISELMNASAMFTKAAQDCTGIKQNIEAVTEKLTDNWNGDSYKAFQKTYLILDRNMNTYTEILQEYAQALKDIASAYKNQDGDIAKAMSKAITTEEKRTIENRQAQQAEPEKEYEKDNMSDIPY